MRVYLVTCQNAVGKKTTVTVQAETDAKACKIALDGLNTYRAITALVIDTKAKKP